MQIQFSKIVVFCTTNSRMQNFNIKYWHVVLEQLSRIIKAIKSIQYLNVWLPRSSDYFRRAGFSSQEWKKVFSNCLKLGGISSILLDHYCLITRSIEILLPNDSSIGGHFVSEMQLTVSQTIVTCKNLQRNTILELRRRSGIIGLVYGVFSQCTAGPRVRLHVCLVSSYSQDQPY